MEKFFVLSAGTVCLLALKVVLLAGASTAAAKVKRCTVVRWKPNRMRSMLFGLASGTGAYSWNTASLRAETTQLSDTARNDIDPDGSMAGWVGKYEEDHKGGPFINHVDFEGRDVLAVLYTPYKFLNLGSEMTEFGLRGL